MLKKLATAAGLVLMCSSFGFADQTVGNPPAVHRPLRRLMKRDNSRARPETTSSKLDKHARKHQRTHHQKKVRVNPGR